MTGSDLKTKLTKICREKSGSLRGTRWIFSRGYLSHARQRIGVWRDNFAPVSIWVYMVEIGSECILQTCHPFHSLIIMYELLYSIQHCTGWEMISPNLTQVGCSCPSSNAQYKGESTITRDSRELSTYNSPAIVRITTTANHIVCESSSWWDLRKRNADADQYVIPADYCPTQTMFQSRSLNSSHLLLEFQTIEEVPPPSWRKCAQDEYSVTTYTDSTSVDSRHEKSYQGI